MPHALLVEDDAASLEALDRLVQQHGFTTSPASTLEQARNEIGQQVPEIAILDLDLPDGNGLELLEPLRNGMETEIVVVTGHGSIDSAVDALRKGVSDYMTKPLDPQRFERVLNNLKRTLSLRNEVSQLRGSLRRLGRFDEMVGSSPPMQAVYDLVTRVARTSSTVLLTGETGSGKDMVAQSIHRLSRRSDKPFVAVNCGAIQPTLIESELFGHQSGSFTGANRTRKGVFELAHEGTLFLDEIIEMPMDLQVKLLRVLEKAVKDGKLREDLLYRLKVFPIHVPPLRERQGDTELLAGFFLEELNGEAKASKRYDAEVLDLLISYEWPGNVRELRNVVERAFILAGDRIGPEHIHLDRAADSRRTGGDLAIEVGCSVAEAERLLILATLDRMNRDKKKTAEVLGISLKTLYNRLNTYGLGRSRIAAPSV
jgi:two-component system, NtrC family, response regulator HydG